MRGILNISMPVKMIKELKAEAKAEGFSTLSEYIRFVIREWKRYRFEKELYRRIKDVEQGKNLIKAESAVEAAKLLD